jgi:hypothetical protein
MSIAKRAGSYQGQVGQLEGFNEPCTKMPSLSDLSAWEISMYYSSEEDFAQRCPPLSNRSVCLFYLVS